MSFFSFGEDISFGIGAEVRLDASDMKRLDRAFRILGDTIVLKVVRKAMTPALKPVLTAARRNRPKRGTRLGLIAKSLGIKIKLYRASGTFFGAVGPRAGFKTQIGTGRDGRPIYENPVNIAHLVEFGTAPHSIKMPGGGTIQHPGAQAQPFLRPAYDTQRNRVVATIRNDVLKGMETEVAKLGRKTA